MDIGGVDGGLPDTGIPHGGDHFGHGDGPQVPPDWEWARNASPDEFRAKLDGILKGTGHDSHVPPHVPDPDGLMSHMDIEGDPLLQGVHPAAEGGKTGAPKVGDAAKAEEKTAGFAQRLKAGLKTTGGKVGAVAAGSALVLGGVMTYKHFHNKADAPDSKEASR